MDLQITKSKEKNVKRIFGYVEVVFDVAYLLSVLVIGSLLFLMPNLGKERLIAAFMSFILLVGDAFHLLPRIFVVFKENDLRSPSRLGRGKQISSITMTIFYILFWFLALSFFEIQNLILWTIIFCLLGLVRIILCLLPQNKWKENQSPLLWATMRNIPFIIMGVMTTLVFFINRNVFSPLSQVWVATLLSFVFYLPVVFFAHKNAKVGMLMLPKTLMYVWLLIMFLFI